MRYPSRRWGFTLVELLVVIGIIALLISILLPVMSSVQGRARDLKCQTNLRQIGIALRGYAEENRGSYPYGFYYTHTVKPNGSTQADWEQAPGNNNDYVCWASSIGKWLHKGRMDIKEESSEFNFPSILQCPEAVAQVRPHWVSYAMNMIVAVNPLEEFRSGAMLPQAQTRPAKINNMMPETALVWDTCVFVRSQTDTDYLTGFDIDGGRFYDGAAKPEYRYYLPNDPWAQVQGGRFGNNKPVQMSNVSSGPFAFKNIDPPEPKAPPDSNFPYQGNLRFRHQGNTACNVVFSDGHVGTFKAKVNFDKTIKSHDALRRYFMIKWPTGTPASEDFAF
jgi:prepilin-type N-terminal cleavage/methylation domain-containing protein/prepilin-type processing-associated H-X9-DG protein